MNPKQILNQAFEAHRNGDTKKAEALYNNLIQSGFKHEAVLNNLSAIWTDRGEYDRAIDMLQRSEISETSAIIQATLAAVYKYQGNLERSITHARAALILDPDLPDTWNNLGSSLRAIGQWDEAVAALTEAIKRKPAFALALYNLGNAYLAKRDLKTAIRFYDQALSADPDYASAHVNRGNCYRELRNYDEAERSYTKAFELNESLLETQFNLGVIYMEQARFTDAISCFSKTITTEDYGIQSLPHIIGATQKICDWKYTQQLKKIAEKSILEGSYSEAPPFNLIAIFDDPNLIFKANQQYTSTHVRPPDILAPNKSIQAPLKIAYFSNDIHDHATGYLIAQLFELHDRNRFEVHLISYGPNAANSQIRQRIQNSGITFVDASLWADPQIIGYIQNAQIQILIDLKGYTAGCRPQILAARPSPIQVQYLGYPATMGCDFIDYFIADPITAPEELEKFFSEKIVRMPACYQINDSKREISNTHVKRQDFGLPEDSFVFASFNSSYKITQDMWMIWLSILESCNDSVLWLLGDNDWAKINLVAHATERGIDTKRIIFADKQPQNKHLERLGLADLALDTYPCCGHTTTSDALYAGLPVLTLAGQSFHSRVSASLLNAQGLNHLIAHSIGQYATTAVQIASSKNLAHDLKHQTIEAKKTGALFNTPVWVSQFENCLLEIHANH